MDYLDARIAIEATAKKQGISSEELINEIEKAIEEAMHSDDPKVQERWRCVPYRGEKPTAVEFIAYMRSLVHKRQQ